MYKDRTIFIKLNTYPEPFSPHLASHLIGYINGSSNSKTSVNRYVPFVFSVFWFSVLLKYCNRNKRKVVTCLCQCLIVQPQKLFSRRTHHNIVKYLCKSSLVINNKCQF